MLILGLVIVLAVAGDTWGYDFQAYVGAAQRILDGEPLYDASVDVAGGFAIYLYPPPFALAFVPFALLPEPVGLWAWTTVLVAAFLAGTATPPGLVHDPVADRPARRADVATALLGQARPGRPAALPCLRGRLAVAR